MNEQIEKYFQGELTVSERLELLKKVETDKEWQAEFTRYQNSLAMLAFSDTVINKEESKQGYSLFVGQKKKQHFYKLALRTIGYAAAIAFLILATHLYHVFSYPVIDTPSELSLYVPPSQRVSLTLQDGTTVWLNAQSTLTYPSIFTGDERRVKIQGEAYFEVAKDEKKPFIVSANGVDMKVLGTTFNVYSYPKEDISRISLVEGSLQVYFEDKETTGVLLKPNEQVTIKGDEMAVENILYNDYFLWREGIYSFYNEPLANILKKLELYYDIEIVVKDQEMLQWRYTVKFRQRDGIDEILRLMQRIHRFDMVRDEENNMITINK